MILCNMTQAHTYPVPSASPSCPRSLWTSIIRPAIACNMNDLLIYNVNHCALPKCLVEHWYNIKNMEEQHITQILNYDMFEFS